MCASVCMCCGCMHVHLCARDYMHVRARMSALHVCIRVHVCACVVGVHVTLCACVSVCVHVTVYTCARACVLSARVSEYMGVCVCARVCACQQRHPLHGVAFSPATAPVPRAPPGTSGLRGAFLPVHTSLVLVSAKAPLRGV